MVLLEDHGTLLYDVSIHGIEETESIIGASEQLANPLVVPRLQTYGSVTAPLHETSSFITRWFAFVRSITKEWYNPERAKLSTGICQHV
jgi:hypothetical protein